MIFILDYKEILKVKEINEGVNFWLVRAKKGVFYNEYKNKKFIALGWNYIDLKNVNELKNVTESDENKFKKTKKQIEEIYKTKSTTSIINKCDRFINEMKIGDIVMIPNAHNEEILFAEVGRYYEEDLNWVKEVEVIDMIDSKKDYGVILECPYKKRREIKIIKSIKGERLNPNLFKLLISHHGIACVDKYGDYILSSLYNLYTWKGNINTVINIEKENEIGAKDFSELIYCTTDIFTMKNKEVEITTKANVNSPGDIIIEILNEGSNFLNNNWVWFVLLWGAISGIKIKGIEIPSIIDGILKIQKAFDYKLDRQKKKIDIEVAKIEMESKKVDIECKKIEMESKIIDAESKKIEYAKTVTRISEENNSQLETNLEKISRASKNLKVDSSAIENVINFDFFQRDDV